MTVFTYSEAQPHYLKPPTTSNTNLANSTHQLVTHKVQQQAHPPQQKKPLSVRSVSSQKQAAKQHSVEMNRQYQKLNQCLQRTRQSHNQDAASGGLSNRGSSLNNSATRSKRDAVARSSSNNGVSSRGVVQTS